MVALKPTLPPPPSEEQLPSAGIGEETETAEEPAGSIVKIITSQGDIVIELFDKQALITAGNFLLLVEDGFYDGVVFHRIIPDFMAQGGDPTGTGGGGPGFTIPDETVPELRHDRAMVSMAKTGAPDSGGSQFFICYTRERTQHLDGVHSVFGRVIEGMEVADQLRKGTAMLKVTVERESPDAEAAKEAAQAARVPA
ncbi:MAG: peptidylprolyl isomerase [Armatimonadetes bacterium]|nr:peptidylprolyl isomerase [Armatimonadota bacterium]